MKEEIILYEVFVLIPDCLQLLKYFQPVLLRTQQCLNLPQEVQHLVFATDEQQHYYRVHHDHSVDYV